MEHYFIVMWVDGNTVKCVSLCVCVRVCDSRMCDSGGCRESLQLLFTLYSQCSQTDLLHVPMFHL